MKQPKKRKCKALLELLGGDLNEEAPADLREARQFIDEEEAERTPLPRCQTSGKVCFSSERQARTAAFNRMRKGANTGRLRVYRCDDCHAFHMSSSFR